MQCCHVKEVRKIDNWVGIIQEFNSMGMLTYMVGGVWCSTFTPRMCF